MVEVNSASRPRRLVERAGRQTVETGLVPGLRLAISAIILLALLACQSLPATKVAASAKAPITEPLTGGLMVVRLLNRADPPGSIALSFSVANLTAHLSVSARLQRHVPGQYADYFVPLSLPVGGYVLTHLRSTATNSAKDEILANLDIPWVVDQPNPVYLGRILVPMSNSVPLIGNGNIEDHFDEDRAAIQALLPELRNATITPFLLSQRLQLRMEKLLASALAGTVMNVVEADNAATSELAEPARSAYLRYLRLKAPRAFAASADGAYGFASGSKAVAKSLTLCVRQSNALRQQVGSSAVSACELMSVDNTWVTNTSCKAYLADESGAQAKTPGCLPKFKRN